MEKPSHNKRSVERHVLTPAVDASFGALGVSIQDISNKGARFKHDAPVEAGSKSQLRFRTDTATPPVAMEAIVVWTQPVSPDESGRYVSGVKLFADQTEVDDVIRQFGEERSNAVIDERSTDRHIVSPALKGDFNSHGPVRIDDLSSRGARIETTRRISPDTRGVLRYLIPDGSFEVSVNVDVVWCHLKAIWSSDENRYSVGLRVTDRHDLQKIGIAKLHDARRAAQDTRSLKLKLRLMPIRSRLGDTVTDRIALIRAIRDDLGSNTEGAQKWLQRAARTSNDPSVRGLAGPIAHNVEALAVWEFMDRTIDPTLIALAFGA